MKVFLAGASGAIGSRLIPLLLARGDEVVAITRSGAKRDALSAAGAAAIVVDALDRGAVVNALVRVKPDVVIHQLTGLTGVSDFRRFDREFALTNRLRTEGTDNLLEGARAAGAGRFVAQSYGNWNYERNGSALKTEADPFDPSPPRNQAKSLAAIRALEQKVVGAADITGIALRYANFYGPGTGIAADGEIVAMVRRRRFPVIGDGAGVWSFIHVDDAASATIAAIERGELGVYNIVDDEPAPVAAWLPELADAVGAKPPRHVPVWLGRAFGGAVGVSMMTRIRGTSNAKAKRELHWTPHYPTYREGFRSGLEAAPPPAAGA
jgi:2-alkyl-3-oxoalkanoate reductase